MEHARLLIERGADARESYAALVRATTRGYEPVLTLMEMVKITRALELRLEAAGALPLQPSPPAPSSIEAPLLPDPGYLQALRAVLVEELERRLNAEIDRLNRRIAVLRRQLDLLAAETD